MAVRWLSDTGGRLFASSREASNQRPVVRTNGFAANDSRDRDVWDDARILTLRDLQVSGEGWMFVVSCEVLSKKRV